MSQKWWILVGVVFSALLTSLGEATGMTFMGGLAPIAVFVVTVGAALIYSDVVNRNFRDQHNPLVWPPLIMLGWNLLNAFLTVGFNLMNPAVRSKISNLEGGILMILFVALSTAAISVGYLVMVKIGIR